MMERDKKEDFRTFVVRWNNKFPLDRWYRKKHNIAFMSEEHKKCSFFQQLFEFEEDRMFKQALEDEEKKVEYVPNIGEWLKDSYDEMVDQETDTKEITQSQIEAFREEMARKAEYEESQKDKE